jgi:hypothetical protein
MTCAETRESFAVALLTRAPLDAQSRAHLDSCGECAAEYRRLAVLPPMLDAVATEGYATAPPPGPALLDRLLAEVARRERRRRRILTLVAAACALALLASGGIWTAWRTGRLSPPNAAAPSSSEPVLRQGEAVDAATKVWARVKILRGDGGSKVNVDIRHLREGTRCLMWVIDRSGHRTPAGSWIYDDASKPGWFVGNTETQPPDVSAVQVVDNTAPDRPRVLITVKLT